MARLDLVTLEDLEQLKSELVNEIGKLLKSEGKYAENTGWMRSSDVRKMLNISPGTLQNFRINGDLAFTKVGGTMFYRTSDIEHMLNSGKSDRKKEQ